MLLWASSQPTATHTLVGLLATRVLPTKINEVLISVAHPRMPINVMEARVWGWPRATKHTKSPPKEEAGLLTDLP